MMDLEAATVLWLPDWKPHTITDAIQDSFDYRGNWSRVQEGIGAYEYAGQARSDHRIEIDWDGPDAFRIIAPDLPDPYEWEATMPAISCEGLNDHTYELLPRQLDGEQCLYVVKYFY